MGPPPDRPKVARLRRPAAQLQRARDAPPRPEMAGCDVCDRCTGTCSRWRQRQREWCEAWGGHPPPLEGGNWRDWWKRAKTQHAQLLTAAADTQQPAPAAAPAAAGKRLAQPDGTPNKGGQRKNAPAVRDRGEGSSMVHSLLLPPSQLQPAEEREIAEVLAVLDAVDIAEAAESTKAAEAAEAVVDAAEAAEAAMVAAEAEAAVAAVALKEFTAHFERHGWRC